MIIREPKDEFVGNPGATRDVPVGEYMSFVRDAYQGTDIDDLPCDYVLRSVRSNYKSYGGYQWPMEVGAVAEADFLNIGTACGGGLHGWWWGAGHTHALLSAPARWMVLKVPRREIIDLRGKVKFPRAKIVQTGTYAKSLAFLKRKLVKFGSSRIKDYIRAWGSVYADGPEDSKTGRIIPRVELGRYEAHADQRRRQVVEGRGLCSAVVGEYCVADLKDDGRAIIGDNSEACVGHGGRAIAGYYSKVHIGNNSEAIVGSRSYVNGRKKYRRCKGPANIVAGAESTVDVPLARRSSIIAERGSLVRAGVNAKIIVEENSAVHFTGGEDPDHPSPLTPPPQGTLLAEAPVAFRFDGPLPPDVVVSSPGVPAAHLCPNLADELPQGFWYVIDRGDSNMAANFGRDCGMASHCIELDGDFRLLRFDGQGFDASRFGADEILDHVEWGGNQ